MIASTLINLWYGDKTLFDMDEVDFAAWELTLTKACLRVQFLRFKDCNNLPINISFV